MCDRLTYRHNWDATLTKLEAEFYFTQAQKALLKKRKPTHKLEPYKVRTWTEHGGG
jgi:hypothetical protein